jgi:CRISPR-associated protein Cas2
MCRLLLNLVGQTINYPQIYIILVFDLGQKRVGRMLKFCRRYLNCIHNSVFEGEIIEAKLLELKHEHATDSLVTFNTHQEKWLNKEIMGMKGRTLAHSCKNGRTKKVIFCSPFYYLFLLRLFPYWIINSVLTKKQTE